MATKKQLALRKKWLVALETSKIGKKKIHQTKSMLGSFVDGFCCLGVACAVAGVNFDPGSDYMPRAAIEAFGFNDACGSIAHCRSEHNTLDQKNDDADWTFAKIAAYVRRYPQKIWGN